MVRAGVVSHPEQWVHGGYREIQSPPLRYRIIDLPALVTLCGAPSLLDLQRYLREWVTQGLQGAPSRKEEKWSTSIAIGNDRFIEGVKSSLAVKTLHKPDVTYQEGNAIKEDLVSYNLHCHSKMGALRGYNSHKWKIN